MGGKLTPEKVHQRAAQKAAWAAAPTIRCSCGAVWIGRAAVNNRVIDAHRQRASCRVTEDEPPTTREKGSRS
jgi:hypothetical protein